LALDSKYSNSYISATVNNIIDLGTHSIFIASVDEAKVLSNVLSMTYQYYFDNVKPKVNVKKSDKKQFACKVCGYVYEGDMIPDDYLCPLCKHGKDAFEEVK
jgi:rubredoxin